MAGLFKNLGMLLPVVADGSYDMVDVFYMLLCVVCYVTKLNEQIRFILF